MTEFKTHEEYVADVLSRFSVQDLVEQPKELMLLASERKSDASLIVIARGENNFIRWWKVQSGSNAYEVRRFKNFIFCSCQSFFYRKRLCKHAAISIEIYCWECFLLSAQGGQLCNACDAKAQTYVRPNTSPALTTVTNF